MIEKIRESSNYISKVIGEDIPKIALVLGSGLGDFVDGMENKVEISYKDIPNFSHSTAPGHKGKLIIGDLEGVKVLCMQGRLHCYEGHSMKDTTYPVRVFKELGVEKLLLTNASGGIDEDMKPGDLMIITDHINSMGNNPLVGENVGEQGVRFPDLSEGYSKDINTAIRRAGEELKIDLREGIYNGYLGPSFETPAEIRMFRMLGANCTGMSTVPEVIVANHVGLEVGAISCISNLASGMSKTPLTEEEVFEVGKKSSKDLIALLGRVVRNIYQ